ncbi:hypothetical protein CROQUDRAFT_78172 [Cronartium quercuum f. sp. fusiforme G11]|uniref:DH domain-containing protein n=1 Tax=Cronartium quercuum f. sp. fusiforme G11 TaxID=708437 RepID=A0A9P6NM04_9BASI|nr:hypothetical protein CROQUDRAFT_78172 [Cronartium quercuum f. sp. fusiforme G11]
MSSQPNHNIIINNNSNRPLRPRRSAASLRSIPERPSKELDQPPLPIPLTPWIEPATPLLHNQMSNIPNQFSIHPSHVLSPNDRPPINEFAPLDSPSSLPPIHDHPSYPSTPGLRDQRLLTRHRPTSQSLSTRHSEGSQYATSSSAWTPSSATGSRLGFEPNDKGIRTSIASRDSRFTAETDYEDYGSKPLPLLPPTTTNSNPARAIHLAMSASWHGLPAEHNPSSPPPPPVTQPISSHPNQSFEQLVQPTIVSLIHPNDQADLVGLGITSDQVVSATRSSRSPSLSGRAQDGWRSNAHNSSTLQSAKQRSTTLAAPTNSSAHSRAPTPIMMETLTDKASNSEQSKLTKITVPAHSLGLAVNQSPSITNNPNEFELPQPRPSTTPSSATHQAQRQSNPDLDDSEPASVLGPESSEASKAKFYQKHHLGTWDVFGDCSPVLPSNLQIPSQAVVLAEEGRGRIIDFATMKCQLEDLEVPDDTTHLLLPKIRSPYVLGSLLSSRLSSLTSTLVVLDISDSELVSLPAAIASCTALEELNISGNVCASGDLPAWIAHLLSLKVFAADRCGLVHLVNPLGNLSHLHDLSLRFNHLKSLPSWLCHLQALEVLLVDGNDFEPPWLELAEPLLSANYRLSESEPMLPSASSTSEVDSISGLQTYRHGPSEAQSLRSASQRAVTDPRPTRPPFSPPNSAGRLFHRSGLPDFEPAHGTAIKRSDSVESDHHRDSYIRRLRSAGDIASASNSRPGSYHEKAPNQLLGSLIEAEASVASLHEPLSVFTTAHSTSSNLQLPLRQATPAPRGTPQGLNIPPPPIPPIKDQKKAFGFLKKMSLGKLRRDPPTARARTKSIEARAATAYLLQTQTVPEASPFQPQLQRPQLSALMDSSKSVSEEVISSTREAFGGRPLLASIHSADTSEWPSLRAEPQAPPQLSPRGGRRRSFLKIEPHLGFGMGGMKFEPLPMIPSWTHSLADADGLVEDLIQQATHSGGPISQTRKELPSTSATPTQPSTNRSSTIDPRTGLRSIMMYLRDVHDLAGGEPAVAPNSAPPPPPPPPPPPGSNMQAVLRPGVSRASSMKQFDRAGNTLSTFIDLDGEPDGTTNAPTPPTAPNTTATKVSDNPTRRMKVIEEVISTEKSYIRGLRELQDIYIASAIAMGTNGIGKEKEAVVPASERKVVFGNVEAIIGFHVEVLLPDLQEVMDRLIEKQLALNIPSIVSHKAKGASVASRINKKNGEISVMIADANLEDETIVERKKVEINGELIKAAAEEIAKVFIRHAAFLKLYSTYITQFDTALERLREWTVTTSNTITLNPIINNSTTSWQPNNVHTNNSLQISPAQKKRLKAYLKKCRSNPSHSQMNLESYLLMPVQRLPRYKLLLENLQSCTPDSNCCLEDDDHNNVEGNGSIGPNRLVTEALSLISAVTAEMNERKRDSEGRQRLLYWQQRFGNKFRSPLVQPHRTLIKEGRVTLMRTVKLTTKDVFSATGTQAKVRVPALSTDSQSASMIMLLCTDLLVLVRDPGDGGAGPASASATLHQALRLAQHTRTHISLPASVFGAEQTMVRFVDPRAIFYFQCGCQRTAAEWAVAVNQQVPLL